jgi:hypothetical protein
MIVFSQVKVCEWYDFRDDGPSQLLFLALSALYGQASLLLVVVEDDGHILT